MSTQPCFDQLSPFRAQTWPPPADLGRALERNARVPRALLQLCFGEQVAAFAISDPWSACCELLLEAQLVREHKLNHFVVDVEQIFDLSYAGDVLFCTFSREHVFAVSSEDFAAALEQLVDDIFAGTTCPRLMRIAAGWGASAIRALPYSFRFSDSPVT
jgi:hypothetical protein